MSQGTKAVSTGYRTLLAKRKLSIIINRRRSASFYHFTLYLTKKFREMPKRIYFLGPKETFTEQAARLLRKFLPEETVLEPVHTLQHAITAAANDDFAVLPYYNLYEGLVQETLDLVTEFQLTILAAQRIAVRFALGGFPAGGPIYSHPKALAQCSGYLLEHFPQTLQHETFSTADAVARVAETKEGMAVARREAFEKWGLPVLDEDIGNRQYGRSNFTEFLLIGRKQVISVADRPYRTMIGVIPSVDRVGLLADILGQMAFFGINLLKIHSRPALLDHATPNDPQMFYLEMQTRATSREFQLCRETLDLRLSRSESGCAADGVVRLLGDYPLFTEESSVNGP